MKEGPINYRPNYIKLTIEEGKAFIEKNKNKLESNFFLDYMDYYNKSMMNCKNVYDKNWNQRIVIRKNIYGDYYQLNELYKDWFDRRN